MKMRGRDDLMTTRRRGAAALLVLGAACISLILSSQALAACPNDGLRVGASANLPDCRAYEQATPVEKIGNSANGGSGLVKASNDGNGITYLVLAGLPGSEGLQDFPIYMSNRNVGWSTRNLQPPAATGAVGQVLGWTEDEAYSFVAARNGFGATFPFTFYMRNNTTGALQEVVTGIKNNFAYAGASTGASVVAFESKTKLAETPEAIENKPNVYIWNRADEALSLGSVLNTGASPNTEGAIAGPYDWWSSGNTKVGGPLEGYYAQAERVLSEDASRLFFTSASAGQIYMRQNPTAPQSALAGGVSTANGAAMGSGTVTTGSNTISSLVAASGSGKTTVGSPILTAVKSVNVGRFIVGQPITPVAGKIPAGATVTAIEEIKAGEFNITMSANAESTASNVVIASAGPMPFAVGQRITGVGIPFGTTITAVAPGSLTLSANATASNAAVALTGSTSCTEAAKACTVQINASERTTPDSNGPKPAAFIGATPDGSAAFFMSASALTDSAKTGPTDGGNDLYRYRPDAPIGSRLTDISIDSTNPNGAEVKGVLGFSGDGSYVYFVAAGKVDGTTSPPSTCTGNNQSTTGLCNVYVWHEDPVTHSTTTSFVTQLEAGGAVLKMRDRFNWSPRTKSSTGEDNLPIARVAEGGALLFASILPLTGQDNVGPNCNQAIKGPGPCTQIYRYVPGIAPRLNCISCNPNGAAPRGLGTYLFTMEAVSQPKGPAVFTRNMSADGNRIFFESPEKLVPADTNGDVTCPQVHVPGGNFEVARCQDVYQWEANGTGSCTSEASNGGCISLVSTGVSTEPSFFADNDSSGDNVFFFTYESLVSQDIDQLVDIYDARVNGGIAAQNPPKPAICEGEGCKGTAAPTPGTETPGSNTFVGPANKKPPKHKKKKKPQKHKKKKAKSHGKSKKAKGNGKSHR